MGIANVPLCPCFFWFFLVVFQEQALPIVMKPSPSLTIIFCSPKAYFCMPPKLSRFPPVFSSRKFQLLTFRLCVREFQKKLVHGAGSRIWGPGHVAVSTPFDARLSHHSGDWLSTCTGGWLTVEVLSISECCSLFNWFPCLKIYHSLKILKMKKLEPTDRRVLYKDR